MSLFIKPEICIYIQISGFFYFLKKNKIKIITLHQN